MRLLPATIRLPLARALALFFALFTLLNIAGAWRSPGFDANQWWIDLAFLPAFAGSAALALAALALFSFGIGRPERPTLRRLIALASAALAAVTFWNVLTFYALWLIGHIHPAVPIPLSLVLSFTLAFIARIAWQPWTFTARLQRLLFPISFLACFILFPLAQMYCFGKTDYRRKADVIVVFGARTYADGTPSQALADRVRTAAALFHENLASLLIFSGGPGDGPTSEPQAMRTLALSLGVPAAAILLDESGLNTDQTVANTVTIFRDRHLTRILTVSHFYHLPRIKMTYSRALAPDNAHSAAFSVFTVPAQETSPLVRMPVYIMREVAALWAYYFHPLWR